jgi:hypothetical protein
MIKMQTKRVITFLFGCILMRLTLTLIAYKININYLPYLGYLALVMGLSFIYLFVFGNKKADTQLEWLGDKYIWWTNLRPLHGFMYLTFAYLAIQRRSYAWMILLLDTFIGLGAWLLHHKII